MREAREERRALVEAKAETAELRVWAVGKVVRAGLQASAEARVETEVRDANFRSAVREEPLAGVEGGDRPSRRSTVLRRFPRCRKIRSTAWSDSRRS